MKRRTVPSLAGRRVVVTRAEADATRLSHELEARGARVIEVPTIARRAPRSYATLDEALRRVRSFDWLLLASPHTASVLASRMRLIGMRPEDLAGVRIGVTGPRTASVLAARGLAVHLMPETSTGASLARALIARGAAGTRVLLPRAAGGRDELPLLLSRAGARVTKVTAYVTEAAAPPPASLLAAMEKADAFTFTSPSTARCFFSLLGPRRAGRLLRQAAVACIGPTTGRALRALGSPPDVIPPRPDLGAMADAIAHHLAALP